MSRVTSIQTLVESDDYYFVLDSVNWKGRSNIIVDNFNVTAGRVTFRGSKDPVFARDCTYNIYDISDDSYYLTDFDDIKKNFNLFLYRLSNNKIACVPYHMFHKFSYKHLDINTDTMTKYIHSYFSTVRVGFGTLAEYIGSIPSRTLDKYGYMSHDHYLSVCSKSYAGVSSMEEAKGWLVFDDGSNIHFNKILTSEEAMKRDWLRIQVLCKGHYRYSGKQKWYLSGYAPYHGD